MSIQMLLVTGATGATGGYAVERLLERGHAVRALAHRENDRSKRLQELGAEVEIVANMSQWHSRPSAKSPALKPWFQPRWSR
jgi:uncharacterized protein YbjT (DUF2867 family)